MPGERLQNACRIAVAGVGTIARARHLPAIAAHPGFVLTATIDPGADGAGVPHAASLDAARQAAPGLEAVSVCTPPQWRHVVARQALEAGLHVLLEKPPCASLGELQDLQQLAAAKRLTLFTAWHEQFAAAVGPARRLLAGRRLRGAHVTWRGNVRDWRPGQDWVWQPGGLGVFDTGMNALSILTRILPEPFWLRDAWFEIPSDCATPIAARLLFALAGGGAIEAVFDGRGGADVQEIVVAAEGGETITLKDGGAALCIGESVQELAISSEYRAVYGRFHTLIRERRSDVDDAPLLHAADAFLRAQCHYGAPFGREKV